MNKKKLKALKQRVVDFSKRALKRILIAAAVFHVLQILVVKWFCPALTLTQMAAVLDGYTFHRESVALSDISTNLQLAVISAEDQLFAAHNGFDVDSIKKAMAHNQKGGTVRGASTISQQTAKNVFLWQGRSWVRKGLEVYYTFLLEQLYGKERILELYLNVAEMGPGIFGAEAASQIYFKKSAANLTPKEAALIAACLPNPKNFNPSKPNAHIRKKANWILSQMAYLKTRPNTRKLIFPQ